MTECEGLNPEEVENQFPADSTPENRLGKVSALCSYGMRPHVMTGLLRQLLKDHFADPNNIEEPRIRKHLGVGTDWAPVENDLKDRGILVESITRWNPQNADMRPAVLIKRNSWRWQRKTIGDRSSENLYTGATSYTGFWEGSHTLYCMAPNGAETEFLTTEIVRFLLVFSPLIVDQMNLMRFLVSEVGGIGEVQEVIQGYAVPVTVSYVAEETWELQPHAPRAKRIVFKASELTSY